MPTIREAMRVTVRSQYPSALCHRDIDNVFRIKSEKGYVIGFAMTPAQAWKDAADNLNRSPFQLNASLGSPTQSLASDEQYWKGPNHAKAIP